MTKNIVVKPLLKNNSPTIKNHLTTSNAKTKHNVQRKYGILSQQITMQKLRGKWCEDVPL